MQTSPKSAFLKPQISTTYWLQLPYPIRMEMRRIFEIPRTSVSSVQNGLVDGKQQSVQTSDGTTAKDLAVLTVDKLQEFLCSNETDILKLFEEVAQKINAKIESEKPSKELKSREETMEIKGSGEMTSDGNIVNNKSEVISKKKHRNQLKVTTL